MHHKKKMSQPQENKNSRMKHIASDLQLKEVSHS